MNDDGDKREYSVFITAGAWYDKVVLVAGVDAVEEDEGVKKAVTAHSFPEYVRFGPGNEPIDIVDVSKESAHAARLADGGWRVRLVAKIAGCGTFLHYYADADEATKEGSCLFPGWPDELGDGWAFSQTDFDVEEVEETEKQELAGFEAEGDADDERSSPALAGTA